MVTEPDNQLSSKKKYDIPFKNEFNLNGLATRYERGKCHTFDISDPSDDPVEEVESVMNEASGESEADTSRTDASSECGGSLENGGREWLMGLTFPRHDLACHVADDGDEVVTLGLIEQVRASLGATARC